LDRRYIAGDRGGIIDREILPRTRAEASATGRGAARTDDEQVRSEAADLLDQALAGSGSDRDHRNDGAGADHQTERGQHRPQRIAP
jgi:hypothetical protein